MTVFDDERAAISRTPQALLVLGVRYCGNHYASGNVPNQILRTEEFDDAAWVKTGVTVTAADAASPLGESAPFLADKLAFAAVGDNAAQSGNVAAASTTHRASIWLKATSGSGTITLDIRNDGAGLEETSKQVSLTTAWERFDVQRAFGAGAGGNVQLRIRRATGDLAEVHAWGAQLTQGANLFSYRKNIGARLNASRCTATDAGDGSRCYYTVPTCQDRPNFMTDESGPKPGIREYKFCLKDAALPLPGEDVLPYLRSVEHGSQKIDPERAVTVNERITFGLVDDAGPGLWDARKSSEGAKVNTQEGAGTFWRRFLAIHKNYSNPNGYAVLKAGYVVSGMTEALYEQKFKGKIRNLTISSRGEVELEAVDVLKLIKAKLPAKISDTNLLNGAINSSQTTITVDDATELTAPGTGYTITIQIDSEKMNVTAISGNVLTVQRGRWGTTAASHSNNAVWSEIVEFGTERATPSQTPIGKNPIDIVIELLARAGLGSADVDTTALQSERDTWLKTTADAATGAESGPTLRRPLTEQTEIEELIKEIREVFMLDLWVGEDQRVSGRVFAPPTPEVTLKELSDDANLIAGSVEVDDNDESRLTRILMAWDLIAGEQGDAVEDYNKRFLRIGADEEASAFYGAIRQKTILSKWLRPGDTTSAASLTAHMLGRFRQGVRIVKCMVEGRDDDVRVGEFVKLTTSRMQDQHGVSVSGRIMQVLKKTRQAHGRIALELMDTGLIRRYIFIAPSGQPDYDSATEEQKRYWYIGRTQNNTVGAKFEDGYYIW